MNSPALVRPAQGHVGTVLLLLACGADANVTDRHGDTALWKLVDQDTPSSTRNCKDSLLMLCIFFCSSPVKFDFNSLREPRKELPSPPQMASESFLAMSALSS